MSRKLSKACLAVRLEMARLPADIQDRLAGAIEQARDIAGGVGECPETLRDAVKHLAIVAIADFMGEGGEALKAQMRIEFPEFAPLLALI